MFEQAKLQDFIPGDGARVGAHTIAFDDADWIDVDIPGDVHRALVAAGRIADPYYDRNEELCAWMEDREWWYRLRFTGVAEPVKIGERLHLIFHGLDTYATIWLNGVELGRHANMFTPASFDVTDLARAGDNTLAILFDRPLAHLQALDGIEPWGHSPERIPLRKAQYGYGWDWGPRLPTIGVWRPIELKHERQAVIDGLHVTTLEIEREARRAALAARVEVQSFAHPGALTARVQVVGPDGTLSTGGDLVLDSDAVERSGTLYLTVEQPRLWWTHDRGEPALYTVHVTLEDEDRILDRYETRVGIRTVELDQSPDQQERGARFFRFVLNGVPLFAKGANWIPADSFIGSLADDRYAMLLEQARAGRMNMLRVWGGGVYEHDAFYDLCDRLGLLVWQDFMFSCAPYPDNDESFVTEVAAEARYQVRRLRNHASLALWCGNNENQWLHNQRYWDRPEYAVPGTRLYSETLPATVAREDGRTPYWPGSPFGGDDDNSMEDGDVHDWYVWHGSFPRHFNERPRSENTPEAVSFTRYADNTGRFISEFGMHAAPVLETLRRVIPPDQLYHHSAAMDHHNKDTPKDKGDNLMLSVTGRPDTLDAYIDDSMIAQAEGLKFGVEHFRRRTPHCSGTLVWQFNDCWPVLSWSVVDYYGVGKAGFYYLKRAYASVLASFKALPDGSLELWLTNDTDTRVEDSATVRLGAFDGAIVREERYTVDVAARTSRSIQRWESGDLQGAPDRYLWVTADNGRFEANRHLFAAIKDVRRTRPAIDIRVEAIDPHVVRVELFTPAYAYFVHLLAPDPSTRFSDNYLDLPPGERVVVHASTSQTVLRPEDITVAWR